jgi:hypothetical protein
VGIKVLNILLLVDHGRIRIRRNKYGSGSGRAREAKKLLNPMDLDLEHCLVHVINVQIVGANYQDVNLSLFCSVSVSDHGN